MLYPGTRKLHPSFPHGVRAQVVGPLSAIIPDALSESRIAQKQISIAIWDTGIANSSPVLCTTRSFF